MASADLAEFLRAHGMAVPTELAASHARAAVVVVEDDPGYLKALVRTIEHEARTRSHWLRGHRRLHCRFIGLTVILLEGLLYHEHSFWKLLLRRGEV